MTRSRCFEYDCEIALNALKNSFVELHQDMARRAKQETIEEYFHKN